jgi:hypothetical protein
MSYSRWISLIAALGGSLAAVSTLVGQLDKNWGIGVTIAALLITTFCERLQGGKSKRGPLTLLVVFLVIGSVVSTQTACGGVKNAVRATARLAGQVENLEANNEKAFDAGKISEATALKVAHVVKDQLNPAVKAYTEFVAHIAAVYPVGSGVKVPRDKWAEANKLFNAVQEGVRAVLDIYGVLSPEQNAILGLTIAAIEEIIAIIRGGFAEIEPFVGGPEWRTV